VESFIEDGLWKRVVDDVHKPHVLASSDNVLCYTLAIGVVRIPSSEVNHGDMAFWGREIHHVRMNSSVVFLSRSRLSQSLG
jgi:hypothetical protein